MARIQKDEVAENNGEPKIEVQPGSRITIPPPEPVIFKKAAITAPKFGEMHFTIEGTTVYVQNRFSAKAQETMRATQEAGQQARKGKVRQPKDFQQCYEDAKHVSQDGWVGIPSSAFRKGCISVCRLVNFKMTLAKLSVFTYHDGLDRVDKTPLTRITKGEPEYSEMPARNDNGSCDLRARPLWQPGWQAVVRVRYDMDQFSPADMINLMHRVGQQAGIGEGRPSSPKSDGMGWGLFEVIDIQAVETKELVSNVKIQNK